jgi:hypothetical protein
MMSGRTPNISRVLRIGRTVSNTGSSGEIMSEKIKILTCTCKHAFQDETYGIGKRVFNLMASPHWVGSDSSRHLVADYRCTVCGHEISGIPIS